MSGLAVPGTNSAEPVKRVAALTALPVDAAALLDAAGGFFASRVWWDIVTHHALPASATPYFAVVHAGGATAVFPMLRDAADGEERALTTPYTCLYEPLIGTGGRHALFTAFARSRRAYAITRLDALDEATAADLAAAGRDVGLAVTLFAHFGNWHETVAGLDWPAYLATRPGALRETIRRRARRVERQPNAVFRLFHDTTDLETGIAAFEAIYARSWKQPEPFPGFNPAQIRAAASLGIMRLGVWWIDGSPAAAQFWIVEHGQATVLKLAHDEAFKTLSLGTILTARMIRHMLEHEGVTELDFGRGDDPYKRDWTVSRRPRMGVLLINPRHPRGLLALARHAAGRIRARLRNPV